MLERRRYVRLNIPLEVNYIVKGKEPSSCKTITKNISPSGARFDMNQDFPKGTVLDINIKIPTKPDPIPIKAKVVWCRKRSEEDENAYDVGFEFVKIPEESKNLFFQYLCNLMYDQLKEI